MYRLRILLAIIAIGCLPAWGWAADGVTVVSAKQLGSGVVQYTISWTSTAAGAVSGHPLSLTPGNLLAVKFVPATGGTQPSDLYDATLVDADGVDVLNASASNLSNASGRYFVFDPPLYFAGSDSAQTVDLVIANAGNANTGTLYIWIEIR